MKNLIKKLLREGIDKNIEFINIGEEIYNKVVDNLDNIKYSKLTKNDTVLTTDNKRHSLKGIKFNLNTFDERFDVELKFCNQLNENDDKTPAAFDPDAKQLLFFIYPYSPTTIPYSNYVKGAKQLFLNKINESLFVHEFTHYLDFIRYKPSYKFNFPEEDPYKYYNSAEELNANFNEVLNKIQKSPMMLKFPVEMFINSALQLFDEEILQSLSVKNLNKYKNRLYQYYKQHKDSSKPINERIFDSKSIPQVKILEVFVEFAAKELEIKNPRIVLQSNHKGLVTTAAYADGKIYVYVKERALVDIMRSIAHEMTHLKQDNDKRLEKRNHDANNAAGSPIEDEANSKAGEIIRKFGEKFPKIYL